MQYDAIKSGTLGAIISTDISLPERSLRLETFGFKFTGGAHISKTMMLEEISKLINGSSQKAMIEEYHHSVVDNNLLSKATQSTRQETYDRLRSLYGLDHRIPLFSIYRDLIFHDPQSVGLLSLLVSWVRDPLLRATTPAVFQATYGMQVKSESIQHAILKSYPDRYSQSSLGTTSRNAASTWTQSGHLAGKLKKVRCKVNTRPASVTLSLILGDVAGYEGENLFSSPYVKLLDLNQFEVKSMASQAHRENLLTFKTIGDIVDISFNQYKPYLEGLI